MSRIFQLHRYRLFEINDQSWFPPFLRRHVQTALTFFWTNRFPLIQFCSPAASVATVLRNVLPRSPSSYTFVDFCSGAGGPVGEIERIVNSSSSSGEKGEAPTQFVVTDIHPHLSSWTALERRSAGRVTHIPQSVDATSASTELVAAKAKSGTRVFRTFFLAFHHFDDEGAKGVMRDAMRNSDGIGIFELQNRSFTSVALVTSLLPMLLLITPVYSVLRTPPMTGLFFTYGLPVIPLVMVFDGLVSSLRTRTPEEIYDLALSASGPEEMNRWTWSSGKEQFFWPLGYLRWVVGLKKHEKDVKT